MGDKSNCGYKFNNRYRGQAIIIVNECFPNLEEPNNPEIRKGAKSDLIKMELLFRYLGFYVTSYMDLKGSEIINKTKLVDVMVYVASKVKTIIYYFEALNDKEKNKDSDCFVFVISTHGCEVKEAKPTYASGAEVWHHAVFGTDYKDDLLYTEDIMSMFADTNDDKTGLKGKPKLFFLQACRSRYSSKVRDVVDYGHEISYISCKQTHPAPESNADEILKLSKDVFVDDKIYSGWVRDNGAIRPWDDVGQVLGKIVVNVKDGTNTGGNQSADSSHGHPRQTEDNHSHSGNTGGNSSQSGDTADAGHSSDTGKNTTQLPFEVVPINCPRDCLVMYPVQSRKYALRGKVVGSWMLHFLHQHKQKFADNGLLPGLTKVMGDMAAYESIFKLNYSESMDGRGEG